MTSRARMLVAMRHGTPDRVPAAPDENITTLVEVCETHGRY